MGNQFTRGATFGTQITSAQEFYDLIEKATANPDLISNQSQDVPVSTDMLLFLQIATGLLKKGSINSLTSLIMPSGVSVPFAGSSVPSGWLLCDGSAVSRSAYPSLFAAIGTTYGVGDGSTTFNLPDSRGRVVAGLDTQVGGVYAARLTNSGLGNPGIDSTTLGATGGAGFALIWFLL